LVHNSRFGQFRTLPGGSRQLSSVRFLDVGRISQSVHRSGTD
jgi:hypothetical protein